MKLQAINLSKKYKGGKSNVWALKNINLEVEKGEFLAIIGHSGAGKSTLLHLLGVLDSPSNGEIFLDDTNINLLNTYDKARVRNKKIGFIFQFYHLLPEFTALENVMLPAKIRRSEASETGCSLKDKAKDILKRLGLENRMSHHPSELSGGEQQRVAIARALINEPELLLCDEPTGNLDSQNGKVIMNILKNLNEEGKTLIIVSHQQGIANQAHQILEMKDGKLSKKGIWGQ